MSNIIAVPESGLFEINHDPARQGGGNSATASVRLDGDGNNSFITGSNFGIGTNNPQFTLDVDGSIHGTSGNFSTAITVGGNPVMTGVSPESDTLQTVTARGATSNQAISVSNIVTSNEFVVGNQGKVNSSSTVGLQLQSTSTNKPIKFLTNVAGQTERMRIEGDGKVGIGISDPDTELEVGGTIKASTHADAIVIGSPTTVKWKMGVYGANDLLIRDPSDNTKFSILSGGNVGIGTTGPSQKLHVKGIGMIEDASSTDFGTLQFGTNTTRYIRGNSAELQVGATIQQLHFQKTNGPAQVASSAANGVTAIQLLARNVHTSANLLEVVNGNGQTADFVIDSNGKVGIGTTNPDHELQVKGDISIDNESSSVPSLLHFNATNKSNFDPTSRICFWEGDQHGNDYTTSNAFIEYNGSTAGGGDGYLAIGGATTAGSNQDIMVLNRLGRVGIGTTSPAYKLHVAGTVGLTNQLYFTGTTADIQIGSSWGNGVLNFKNGVTTFLKFDVPNSRIVNNIGKYLTQSNGTAQFGTLDNQSVAIVANNSTKMTILSGGNVGIGITNPASKLHVAGTASIDTLEYNSVVSVFGQSRTKLNELSDVFYQADKRFTVTGGSPIFFNGNFDQAGNLTANTTNVININVAGQQGVPSNGITYPQGAVYISFYYTNHAYTAISLRHKSNGVYYSSTGTNVSTNSGYKVIKFPISYANYLTDIEISITTDANTVSVAAINYLSDRWNTQLELPYVSKYLTSNTVFGEFGISGTANNSGPHLRLEGTYTTWELENQYTGGANNDMFRIRNTALSSDALVINRGNNRVGIGTTNPENKLHVVGTRIRLDSNAGGFYKYTGGGGFRFALYDDSSKTHLFADGDGSNPHMTFNAGFVGIGTENPTSPLTIKSSSVSASDSALTIQGNSNTNAIVKIAEKSTDGARLHMYDGGVEKIAFYTDGTDNHISAGNVGIGTTSPHSSSKLHVNGQIRAGSGATFTQAGSSAAVVAARSFGYGSYSPQMNGSLTVVNTNTAGTAGFISLAAHYGNTNNTIYSAAGIGGGKETTVGDGNWGGYLNFFTTSDGSAGAASGAFEHMRITADGNVGIGITDPDQKLDVNGNIRIPNQGKIVFGSAGTATDYLQLHDVVAGNPLLKLVQDNVERFSIEGVTGNVYMQGNVGIGTTSPTASLHINKSTPSITLETAANSNDPIINLKSSGAITSEGAQMWYDNSIGSLHIQTTYPNNAADIVFHTATGADKSTGNVRMVIGGDGNVGIGTTSPAGKLDVRGGMSVFETTLTNNNDWQNSAISILERDNVGVGQSADKYSPNLNFHWRSRVSNSLWMNTSGYLNWGSFGSNGIPNADGVFQTNTINLIGTGRITGVDTVTASTDAANKAYVDAQVGSADTLQEVTDNGNTTTNNIGIGTTSPAEKLEVVNGNIQAKDSGFLAGANGAKDGFIFHDLYTSGGNYYGYKGFTSPTRLSIVTNGIEGLTIDANSNVGIGVGGTNPDARLRLKGAGGSSGLTFKTTDFSNNETFYVFDGGRAGVRYSPFSIGIPSTTPVATNAVFQVEEAGLLTVLSTGNVGIGTANPKTDLAFGGFGSIWVNNDSTNPFGIDTVANELRLFTGNNNAYQIKLGQYNGTTFYPRLTIGDGSSNKDYVGIGTTSPAVKLEIKTATSDTTSVEGLRLYNAGGGIGAGVKIGLGVGATYSEKAYLRTDIISGGSGRLFIGVNGSDRVLIDNAGNVGIGTTSPSYKLDVAGDVKTSTRYWAKTGTSGQDLVMGFWDAANARIESGAALPMLITSYQGNIKLGISGGTTMTVKSTAVGIGTTSPSQKLQINGVEGLPATTGTSQNALLRLTPNAPTNGESLDFGMRVNGSDSVGWIQATNFGNLGSNYDIAINPNGGNVGIGTNNPSGELHVKNVAELYTSLAGSDAAINFVDGQGDVWRAGIRASDNSFRFSESSTSLGTNPRVTIATGGNVGIGTDTPSDQDLSINTPKLHVVGPSTAGAFNLVARFQGGSDSDNTGAAILINHSNDRGLLINAGRASSDREVAYFNLVSSGAVVTNMLTLKKVGSAYNVGIGTTNPFTNLEVAGSGLDSIIRLYAGGGTANIRTWEMRAVGVAGEGLLFRQVNDANNSYTNRMIIDTNGDVGIGTITPSKPLHVSFSGDSGARIESTDNHSSLYIDSHSGKGQYIRLTENNADKYWINSSGGKLYFRPAATGTAANQVIFDSSGNVGIGTTSPDEKLHIEGSANGNVKALIENTNVGSSAYATLGFQNNLPHSVNPSLFLNGTNNTNYAGANSLNMYQYGSYNLGFVTNNTLRMVVAGDGNVGIGTNSPDSRLDVTGGDITVNTSAAGFMNFKYGSVGSETSRGTITTDGIDLRINATADLIFQPTGNVGIGTVTPDKKLQISESNTSTSDTSGLKITNTSVTSNTNAGILFENYDNNGAWIRSIRTGSSNGKLSFGTNSGGGIAESNISERMVIDHNGNVGIGITNPSQNLEVGTNTDVSAQIGRAHVGYMGFADYAGFAHLDRASTSNYALLHASWGDTYLNKSSGRNIYFRNNNSTIGGFNSGNDFYVDTDTLFVDASANRVGIGTTNPSQKLHVEGNLELTSSFEIGSNSGSYWQRIRTEDAVASTTNAFNFETRNGSGSFIDHMVIRNDGNVGIGVTNPSYTLQVGGSIVGLSKSFLIKHPTKEGKQLLHACIEGPENGVYFRGKSTSSILEMPDYWIGLVHIDSMTVDITAIGPNQDLYVESIADDGEVTIGSNTDAPLNYFYVIYGERKDIGKLEVEIVDPEYSNE